MHGDGARSSRRRGAGLLLAFASCALIIVLYTTSRVETLGAFRSEVVVELTEARRGFVKTIGRAGELLNPKDNSSSSSSSRSSSSSNNGKKPTKAYQDPSMSFTLGECRIYPHADFNGDALIYGTQNLQESAGGCCQSCSNYSRERKAEGVTDRRKMCNIWVWCGDKDLCGPEYQQCWLKHLARIANQRPTHAGTGVGWSSGTALDLDLTPMVTGMDVNYSATYNDAIIAADRLNKKLAERVETPRVFHFVVTTQGARVEWSMRIHYYHFRKQKARCIQTLGNKCEMGGFTRILHDTKPDPLMDEMPSILMDPLPHSVVDHSRYAVLNRPYALMNWIKDCEERIPEKYIFMAEPDHIILHPIPNLMRGDVPVAYPFNYIRPSSVTSKVHIEKHAGLTDPDEIDEIAPIGSSPVIMSLGDMKRVLPVWQNVTVNVFKDPAANKAWGWVQEMYGFAMAVRMVGIREVDTPRYFMAQPPYATAFEEMVGYPYYIIHYTYGLDYNYSGVMLPRTIGEWHFDKRAQREPIKRNMTDVPPKVKNNLVRELIKAFNEATDAYPCWDDYAKSHGKIPEKCYEPPKHFLASEWAQKV